MVTMELLAPPMPPLPDLGIPLGEQVIPGNVPPDEDDGTVSGGGPAPGPLQGDIDQGDPEERHRVGNEGDGP
jgi:hypothetical protein